MNKTLLSILLLSSLNLVACSKQPAPDDTMQEVEISNPASEPLQPLDASSVTAVDIERQQTDHTTTEIRREYYDIAQNQAAEQAANTAATANDGMRVKNPDSPQSEDDAVAAALAAATPAITKSTTKAAPAQPQPESTTQQ